MMRFATTAMAGICAASTTFAAGVDRSNQPIGVLFEQGNYVEFSYRTAAPSVSGIGAAAPAPTPGALTGSVIPGFSTFGAAYKFNINEKLDGALIFDQPFGANVAYPISTYFAAGASANLSTSSLTGVIKYRFNDRFSVYGGLRQQTMRANAIVPFVGGYSGTTGSDTGLGYLVGAAYERPDIALRVALTYNSAIDHELQTVENSTATPVALSSTTSTGTPQSVNLDFQTGIAAKTLLFGSVRWVEWSDFAVSPAHYGALTGGASLVAFNDDRFTYTLGLGRQLNETWSVAASVTHEPAAGGFASNLSPRDGLTSVGLGVTYRQDNFKLQAGLSHIWIGDATTNLFGLPVGNFSGNTATGFGMKMGFSF